MTELRGNISIIAFNINSLNTQRKGDWQSEEKI